MKRFLTCGIVVAGFSASAAAAGFGTIKGQFVLDGQAPDLKPLVTVGENVKDAAVCAKDAVPDQSLVVDPATKGIANIFIWPSRLNGKAAPNLAKPAAPVIKFDQKGCVFEPHALVIQTDQKLQLLNDDAVAHNVHTFTLRNPAINVFVPPNERKGIEVDMAKPESLPLPVKCDIHPWMQSYVLVSDTPYAVVTDAKGEFVIKDLPAGEQTFKVWHEGKGYVDRTWKVKVVEGKVTDVGTVKVPLSKLRD